MQGVFTTSLRCRREEIPFTGRIRVRALPGNVCHTGAASPGPTQAPALVWLNATRGIHDLTLQRRVRLQSFAFYCVMQPDLGPLTSVHPPKLNAQRSFVLFVFLPPPFLTLCAA